VPNLVSVIYGVSSSNGLLCVAFVTSTYTNVLPNGTTHFFCSGGFFVLFCNRDATLYVFCSVHIYNLSHIVFVCTQWRHIAYLFTRLPFIRIN